MSSRKFSVSAAWSRIRRPAWERPFDVLREKWHEVPAGTSRLSTREITALPDAQLRDLWEKERWAATVGAGFGIRGWYHTIYKDILRGKRMVDFGCGFGLDGITFAQCGAAVTFVDIVESNLVVVERLCGLFGLTSVQFVYLDDINSLSKLKEQYSAIWCQGSLINAPFEIIRHEAQLLLKHLPVGGRWIELAYPKVRWEREGRLPFDQWGESTDGPGTPWVEWYDLSKLKGALEPAEFDVIFNFEFHNGDFIWFDLQRKT
jgi:2-polyprenyl-3-methyl-5-hydroxy-6-metoxy-1,4-benzoquinol methylase